MSNTEWTLNSGFPEAMKSFVGWESRAKESEIINKPLIAKEYNNEPTTLDVGAIFLEELKKHHAIENGFTITKLQDIIINLEGSNFNCQLFIVKTPWNQLPSFSFYSPIDKEGFSKFASKVRGGLQIGKQGTIQNPQPLWTWNTLTIDGLEEVDKNGPPVYVEMNGKVHYAYLKSFFLKSNNPLLS
jgi:hypothetical protein